MKLRVCVSGDMQKYPLTSDPPPPLHSFLTELYTPLKLVFGILVRWQNSMGILTYIYICIFFIGFLFTFFFTEYIYIYLLTIYTCIFFSVYLDIFFLLAYVKTRRSQSSITPKGFVCPDICKQKKNKYYYVDTKNKTIK